jgi:hypothetical protein
LHRATQVQMNVATIESLFNVLKNKTNSQQFHQILLLQDNFSETFMNYLIRYQSESNIQLLLPFLKDQLGSKLLQKCLQKGNILHFNVRTSNSKLCFLLEQLKQELNKNEIRELLLAKDVDGNNPLCMAVGLTNNDSNIEIILKFIQDEVDSDTLIEIFSQPSVEGRRILHRATAFQRNVATIKKLFNVLKNITNSQQFHQILFLQDDFSQTFMNYLIRYQSETNIQLLLTFLENHLGSKLFQKCLYDKENQSSPALVSAFLSNSESKIKYFLNFLKEQFGKEVLKELYLFQNKYKRNILHIHNSNSNLSILIEHLKQELNKNEIKELLLAKDVDGKNPLCMAVGYTNNDSNIRIMEELLKEYV